MFKRKIAAIIAVSSYAMGSAVHAALPAGFSGAVTQYQVDAVEAIGLLMAAGIVIWGVLKLKSKLGL